MENPATWGEAEKVIARATDEFAAQQQEGELYGASYYRYLADSLRKAGLLGGHCASCDGHACDDQD